MLYNQKKDTYFLSLPFQDSSNWRFWIVIWKAIVVISAPWTSVTFLRCIGQEQKFKWDILEMWLSYSIPRNILPKFSRVNSKMRLPCMCYFKNCSNIFAAAQRLFTDLCLTYIWWSGAIWWCLGTTWTTSSLKKDLVASSSRGRSGVPSACFSTSPAGRLK